MLALLAALAATLQPADLMRSGAFGFPQAQATILCDTPDLRVSVASDNEHLYLQAVLWNDGDEGVAETSDGREIGDWCNLMIDADADGKATGDVDRNYSLSPWPSAPGLYYQIVLDERGSSGLQADSKGRGRVMYVDSGEAGRRVRVDSLLIPLAELGRKPGDTVRLAYWGSSAVPKAVVNSIGFTGDKPYYSFHLPRDKWHTVTLARHRPTIDVQAVPEGRGTIAVKPKADPPKLRVAPPEVAAADWLHWRGTEPPSLATLKGKVVVVEFWATWCAPCVEGIPHLNELHERYKDKGVVILSLTDQSRNIVEAFLEKTPMHYTLGVKSDTSDAYGVSGIPHAFVIGRDGLLKWEGHPVDSEFDEALEVEAAK